MKTRLLKIMYIKFKIKSSQIPYRYRKQVSEEIFKMLKEGIVERDSTYYFCYSHSH